MAAPDVAIGAALTAYSFSLDSTFLRFDTVGFAGREVERRSRRSTQAGDSHAVLHPGVLIGLSTRARVGVMYRQGPSFVFRTKDGPDEREGRFRVPNTLAVGASFRPAAAVTLAAEITRVQYSRLRRDFVTDQASAIGREADFDIPSGTEIHLGAQYLAISAPGVPKFRAGIWYDPDHSVRFSPTVPATTIRNQLLDELLGSALSTGRGRVHYTGGIGWSLNPRFELNGSFDVTARSRTISASCVIR